MWLIKGTLKLIVSREKVKTLHDQYFEVKKLVPVKIRKTVRIQVDRQVSMSSDIQDGIAAFGQLFMIASQIVEREIEEDEYREVKNWYLNDLERGDKMKKTNDGIIFEDREELGSLIRIIDEWMRVHPKDEKIKTAYQVVKMLDVIEMNW